MTLTLTSPRMSRPTMRLTTEQGERSYYASEQDALTWSDIYTTEGHVVLTAPVQRGKSWAIDVLDLGVVPATETPNDRQNAARGANVAIERDAATEAMQTVEAHTPTVAIIQALDAAYVAVRQANPDCPSAVAITLSTGRGKFHGQFTKSAWQDNGQGHRHEIIVASESLRLGSERVLTTLIHESAHALAAHTDQKDTSRQGRYHNTTFRDIALKMGVVVETDEKIGHHTPGLQEWAKVAYADILTNLDVALSTHRVPAEEKEKAPKTTVRIACECNVPVTVPIKWAEEFAYEVLSCTICEGGFAPVD